MSRSLPHSASVRIPHGCAGSPGPGITTIAAAACSGNPQFDFPFPLVINQPGLRETFYVHHHSSFQHNWKNLQHWTSHDEAQHSISNIHPMVLCPFFGL